MVSKFMGKMPRDKAIETMSQAAAGMYGVEDEDRGAVEDE
jgi:hypothetical protein